MKEKDDFEEMSYYRQKMIEIKKYCKEHQIYEFYQLMDVVCDEDKTDWFKILKKSYAIREINQYLGWQRRGKRHKEAMVGEPPNRRIAKPVVCLDNGMEFKSINEATRWLGIKRSHDIADCCRGVISNVRGYHFVFKEDIEKVMTILTNPSFPQYVKIGYTSALQRRLRELNRSEALPFAFRAYAIYEVEHKLTDIALHELLDQLNPDLRTIETFDGKTRIREFFERSAEDAYSILEAVARISGTEHRLHRVTPTGTQSADQTKAEEDRREAGEKENRRSRFRFSMIGLKPGDVVCYKDDTSKKAIVVDDTHIEYEGITTSLSRLA